MTQERGMGSASAEQSTEIDLLEVLKSFWLDRWLIGGVTAFAAALSLVIALSLPNVYQATALLQPQSGDGGMSGLARQYGGLASLAGISLPSRDGQSKTELAMEVLTSKKFVKDFMARHDILPQFFAPESWEWETNTLTLDSAIYDSVSETWVRDVKPPRTAQPGIEEIHELWLEVFYVGEDKDTGFVTIAIKHLSPALAQRWLELVIHDINETLRAQDLAEAERAVAYLEGQLQQSSTAEIRELLAGLLRSHMESRMVATVESDYAFSVIDPPTRPEKKSEPNRALICIGTTLLGAVLGVLASLLGFGRRSATT
jgi:LPS O-antigen subunit length determinant protein (WzzB/FepE family)